MEAVREKWTDERLDDLNRKVDDLSGGRFASMPSTGVSTSSTGASRRIEAACTGCHDDDGQRRSSAIAALDRGARSTRSGRARQSGIRVPSWKAVIARTSSCSGRSRESAARGRAQIRYQGSSQARRQQQAGAGPAGGAQPVAAAPGPEEQVGEERSVYIERAARARPRSSPASRVELARHAHLAGAVEVLAGDVQGAQPVQAEGRPGDQRQQQPGRRKRAEQEARRGAWRRAGRRARRRPPRP